jgi:hypothetical protein
MEAGPKILPNSSLVMTCQRWVVTRLVRLRVARHDSLLYLGGKLVKNYYLRQLYTDVLLLPYPAEGGLLEADQVHQHTVGKAHNHVHGGDGPWEGEILEDGLVQQVEANVEGIPAVTPANRVKLVLQMMDQQGAELAHNGYELSTEGDLQSRSVVEKDL